VRGGRTRFSSPAKYQKTNVEESSGWQPCVSLFIGKIRGIETEWLS
jgi:hypothetical protein